MKLRSLLVCVLLGFFFGLSPPVEGQQLVSSMKRPNGDLVVPHTFIFGSHSPGYAVAGLTDTLVGADTSTSSNSSTYFINGVDQILLYWEATNINNMDTLFLRTQLSATGETWESVTDQDTLTAAGGAQVALSSAVVGVWEQMRVSVAQQNGASGQPAATDTASFFVRAIGLFKSR